MEQFSAAKYLDGIRACVENIVGLLDDADCLLASNRHARAYALLLIAIEEVAKVNMLKSWAIDRWENKPISKDEQAFRNGIFTDHVGKLRRAGHGLYAAESFKRKWGMKLGAPTPDYWNLMRGMKNFHSAKNKSLYLHIGTGGFEVPTNADYKHRCDEIRGWIVDLLKWVKGGTHYFIEHDVQWHLEEVSESKEFNQSIDLLRKCIERI